MKQPQLARFLSLLFCLVVPAACTPGEHPGGPVPSVQQARTRGRAVDAQSAREVAEAWETAGRAALASPVSIAPSFQEAVRLGEDLPAAVAYDLPLHRAQQLDVEVFALHGDTRAELTIYEQTGPSAFDPVYTLPPGGAQFSFTAPRSGRYLLRLQPQPGRSGDFRLTITTSGVGLVFPSAGGSTRDIRGQYGDPRDGGVRRHDGVDIFAERNTPVLSVSAGVVQTVETTRTGGRVVWVRESDSDLTYFYAHLEKQLVKAGQQLQAGDTLGLVGNSGNASGAHPHLHFGVYRPGTIAINPAPFLAKRGPESLQLVAESALATLGSRAMTRGRGVRLRTSPDESGGIAAELSSGTPLQLLGIVGEWRRVRLDDGRTGFVAGRLLEPAAVVSQSR